MDPQPPETIHHSCLPGSVIAVMTGVDDSNSTGSVERSESKSGRKLLQYITETICNYRVSRFTAKKNEKPSALCDGRILSVSFSHTSEAIVAASSPEWVVGVDVESVNRTVSPQLQKRMKHPDEALKLYEEYPIIQLWTLKEAALKAIGTGLRKPMNGVLLEAVSESLFAVEFFNGIKGNICSFQKREQWISICYISSKSSEPYLEKLYVPIHTGRNREQG